MARRFTERGFVVYDEFADLYGDEVRVQESSLATEPAVLVSAEDGAVILNVELAKRIRDALDTFIAENSVPVQVTDDDGEAD